MGEASGSSKLIVLLRGLPGSGKSTLARALAPHLDAVILDKDLVRAALFPGDTTEYTTAQDDFVISLMLDAAAWHWKQAPARAILLDGRTHSRVYQVDLVRDFASKCNADLHVIECVCRLETARARIEADTRHPAKNRNAALLHQQAAKWEAIPYQSCLVDTEQTLERCVQQALRGIMAP